MEKRPRIVVSTLLKKDNKVLLIKERLEDKKETWIVPGGGVKFGESLEEAAKREIKEEVGVDVDSLKLICYKEAIFVNFDYHTVIFFFLAETTGEPTPMEDKILEARFISQEEISDLPLVSSAKWLFDNHQLFDNLENV